jgi:hypothetical protein
VGDGDLSNGASMSLALKETRPNCYLIASVLESEPQHNDGKSSAQHDKNGYVGWLLTTCSSLRYVYAIKLLPF